MKVVHVFWSLTYGGIETMLVNIANEQAKIGAEVHVVIINDYFESSLLQNFSRNINLHFLGRKPHSQNPYIAFRLTRLIRKIAPHAIHLHDSHLYSMLLSRRLSREASVTLHALPSGMVRRGGMYRLLPILDWVAPGNTAFIDKVPKVFSISQAVHDELLEKYGVKSTVICNGILTQKFEQRGERNISNREFRIVQVSRLDHEKKGQDLLIEAVARMGENIHLDFIGDGDSREYLEHLSKRLGVEARITFHGTQPQDYVASHLKDYDLFAQPSRYEGFGLTVAEAMAAGVPVLVSAGQGPAEVTCGNGYGWTFENGNINDLTDKIVYIQGHYTEAIEKCRKARQHVIENYDVKVTARKYLECYAQAPRQLYRNK